MELSRNRDKIHTRDCRYVVGNRSWVWAEPCTRDHVIAMAWQNGLTECGTCKPFGGELR